MKSYLGALDAVRQRLLRSPDTDEVRLAAVLSCVSKHLATRNRTRCRKLLENVDPATLAFAGLAGVWEHATKRALVPVSQALALVDDEAGEAEDLGWSTDGRITLWKRVTLGPKPLSRSTACLECPDSDDEDEDRRLSGPLRRVGPLLVQVNFLAAGADDETVALLARSCDCLQSLKLEECYEVTDDGVRALARDCPSLRHLDLGQTRVGDYGIRALAMHSSVTDLVSCFAPRWRAAAAPFLPHLTPTQNLWNTSITSAAIDSLSALVSLKALGLGWCARAVDGRGLKLLARCKSLQVLDLTGYGKVTPRQEQVGWTSTVAGLSALVECEMLADINLWQSEVRDADLAALAECPALTSLNVRRCDHITALGIGWLVHHPSLRNLDSIIKALESGGVRVERDPTPPPPPVAWPWAKAEESLRAALSPGTTTLYVLLFVIAVACDYVRKLVANWYLSAFLVCLGSACISRFVEDERALARGEVVVGTWFYRFRNDELVAVPVGWLTRGAQLASDDPVMAGAVVAAAVWWFAPPQWRESVLGGEGLVGRTGGTGVYGY